MNVLNISKNDLKSLSIKGGFFAAITQSSLFVIRLLSNIIIARLLFPEDYGLVAMVTSVAGFAVAFKYAGLSTATVQKKDITEDEVSNLFWINLGISAAITVLIIAISPVLTWFFKEPRLLGIGCVYSTSFIISGAAVQHHALLQKNMEFQKIAVVSIVSLFLAFIVGLVMAVCGFRYWSLVYMQVFGHVFQSIGGWIFSPFKIKKYNRSVNVLKELKFGINLTMYDIIKYFSGNIDKILLGKFGGTGLVGLYTKSAQLVLIPVQNIQTAIVNVALPGLSILQNDEDSFRRYYCKFLSIIAFVTMPVIAALYATSNLLITTLLGAQWEPAIPLFQLLTISAWIQPLFHTVSPVMLSKGRSDRHLKWGIINSVVLTVAIVFGMFWSAKGVAIAYAIGNYLMLLPSLMIGYKDTKIKVRDFVNSVARPSIVSLLLVVSLKIFMNAISFMTTLNQLIITSMSSVIFFFVIWCLMPGGIVSIKLYLVQFKEILSKKPNAAIS